MRVELLFVRNRMQTSVQSVLIPYTFSLPQATAWLDKHHYVHYKVDEKSNFRRFRQYNPRDEDVYRTKVLPNGIRLVIKVNQP